MKLALVHNLPAGGAKRNTYEHMLGLKNRGHTIHEYTFSTACGNYLPLEQVVESSRIFNLKWKPLIRVRIKGLGPTIHLLQNIINICSLCWVSWRMAKEIDQKGFDLVYVTDCMYLITPLALLFLRTPALFYLNTTLDRWEKLEERTNQTKVFQKIIRFPVVLHSRLIHTIQVRSLKRASLVLTNSNFSSKETLANFGIPTRVLYPGVDISIFTPTSKDQNKYILSVGTLEPHKGHLFVIECLALLPEEIRPNLLIVAVDKNTKYMNVLRSAARDLNVHIEFASIQDSYEMAGIYQNAILLAFAPIAEPFGMVVIEALACGIPVVGVNEGGLCETIIDGENGFLVDRNPSSFSRAIRQLIEDVSLRDRLGKQSRRLIENNWSWSGIVEKLDAIIYSVVADHLKKNN